MASRNPASYGKVAVLFGGKSAEREISLQSGEAVLNALKRNNVDARAVDPKDDVIDQLQNGGFDRVFNMLHGRYGEDGVIQGALELLGLPYTGSGVLASALGMDKLKTKEVWIANQIPTPKFCVVNKDYDANLIVKMLGLPLIVKPLHEGSSIGMSKVETEDDLPQAIVAALQLDSTVLVEEWITGAEYTVTILDCQALPVIRLQTPNTFYDYDAKYLAETTLYHCPCGLDNAQETALQALALKAFNIVGAKGWGRIDVMMDQHQSPYLIEINTLPGMTSHSLVPMAAKAAGIPFDDLVMKILESSMH